MFGFCKKHLDQQLFTKLSDLPTNNEWSHNVFSPQLFAASDKFYTVGVPHFARMEALFMIDGTASIIGAVASSVPGGDMRAKRDYLLGVTENSGLEAFLQQGGFAATLSPNSGVLVIPTGFIVMVAYGSANGAPYAHGVRWSLSSDATDVKRAHITLESLLASFPELRATYEGNVQFLSFLAEAD